MADEKKSKPAVQEKAPETPAGFTTAAKPVARVCSENDRAGEGETRFKVRGLGCDRNMARYLLVPTGDGMFEAVKAEYLRFEKLDKSDKPVELFVKQLAD